MAIPPQFMKNNKDKKSDPQAEAKKQIAAKKLAALKNKGKAPMVRDTDRDGK